ncbi:M48 family metalloprotease [Endozoicomonadaceae bacterium StTr2]
MKKKLFPLLPALILSGCVTSNIKPYTGDGPIEAVGEENRLWHAAERFEQQLEKGDRLEGDAAMQAYLQGIMDRLYPEFKGSIRVYILKQPILNAFALPNGGVYVNTGLIAAMENEAQLAAVLAHEGVHFINKHSAKQRKVNQLSSALAMAGALAGGPLLATLGLATTVTGYSRDLEREADTEGYKRLIAAGYDPAQSYAAFEAMAREAKASDVESPLFFSSHPKLQERIKSFKALNENAVASTPRDINASAYQDYVVDLRQQVLIDKLETGRFNEIIATFEAPSQKALYPEVDLFYLAEAHRLRNEKGDLDEAKKVYRSLLSSYETFPLPYKSLGLLSLKEKNYPEAGNLLRQYLVLAPKAEDAAFVQQYLDMIDKATN